MTEREIRKYIDRLNGKKATESIFTSSISRMVDVAKVWGEQPKRKGRTGGFISYRFFFVKDEAGKYVGAILDMGQDLHWYIIPQSRKRGYLTNSLKEAVLPYLFRDNRDSQRITIDSKSIGAKNYLNSKSVALRVGFKAVNEGETVFELKQSEFNWEDENLEEQKFNLDSERCKTLRERAFYASQVLYKISDELLMRTGKDRGLRQVADRVQSYTSRIEDIYWEIGQIEN